MLMKSLKLRLTDVLTSFKKQPLKQKHYIKTTNRLRPEMQW